MGFEESADLEYLGQVWRLDGDGDTLPDNLRYPLRQPALRLIAHGI